MRRWLLVFMLVLLPLRGWAGDVMSVQMLNASHSATAMPADCPMHADAGDTPADGGMNTCAACDLCIPLAELANTRLDVVSFASHEKPLMHRVAYASVCPAPAFKPPQA